jgi:hypothetical protein
MHQGLSIPKVYTLNPLFTTLRDITKPLLGIVAREYNV